MSEKRGRFRMAISIEERLNAKQARIIQTVDLYDFETEAEAREELEAILEELAEEPDEDDPA